MDKTGRKKILCLTGKIFIFPVLLFILSGCSNSFSFSDTGLKKVDDGLGEFFDKFQEDRQEEILNFQKDKKESDTSKTYQDLTDEQKKAIDFWLEEEGYNRYGDAKNAIYTGGTPLFDESTGKAIDRYEYILKKFPDILNKISND